MAAVLFYEKPGCVNNTRQKALLAAAGHAVVPRNLLTEPWTVERLRGFFGSRPIAQWFNPSAPRINLQPRHPWRAALASVQSAKSGEVDPAVLDAETALSLMLADPLLIRRPLIQVGTRCEVGFEPDFIDAWLGLGPRGAKIDGPDIQACPHGDSVKTCEPHS
jgi:arsenate reductase-like glutaredoxin family protein